MNEGPRYATLGDYLRVLRRNRLLILVITLAFGGGAYALSKSQEPIYLASTSISFRDVSQDAAPLGQNIIPTQAGAERSAVNAELVARPEITRAVHKRLKKTELSEDELADAVQAGVDIRTNLVTLEAESSDAELAARIANAFAVEIKKDGDADLDKTLDEGAKQIEKEIGSVKNANTNGPQAIRLSVLQQRLGALETLRSVAEPVVINRRATVPGSPDSPQPARNTVIGVLIGFIIALLIAFVRSALDRRIRTPHEVHQELGLPVLGRIPQSALGHSGLLAGEKKPMGEADFESFRMLRMNLGYLSQDGQRVRSILVTSGLAEEGKSSVSMSLASAAALAGQRVLLVECDLRRPSLAKRLNLNPQPGLTDYLRGDAEPRDILQTVSLSAPPGNLPDESGAGPASASLVCITAGTQVGTPAELLVGERFPAFLEKVSHAYDLVIIDSSPLLAVVDPLEIAPLVDGILICVRVEQTTRDQVRAARAAIATLPVRPMGAVVTGMKRGDRDSGYYYYGY